MGVSAGKTSRCTFEIGLDDCETLGLLTNDLMTFLKTYRRGAMAWIHVADKGPAMSGRTSLKKKTCFGAKFA